MGSATAMAERDYTAQFDRLAATPEGLAFLREHARRAARSGQEELRGLLGDLKGLFTEQAEVLRSSGRAEALRRELLEMAGSIEQARREIAALRPQDDGSDRLMIATNELDAIVSTTERASFEILQSGEKLMELAAKLRAAGSDAMLCGEVEAEVSNLFTACSFQDLTGQRTAKVVNALRYVESRVNAMLSIWDLDGVAPSAQAAGAEDKRPDAHLLGGPRADGVSQDDVDALLAQPSGAIATAAEPSRPRPLDQSAIDNLFD